MPETFILQNLLQHKGPVGHNSINAEIQQVLHLVGFVDGPHVNLQSSTVCIIDQSLIGQRDRALLERNLGCKGTFEWFNHTYPTAHTKQCDLLRTE